MSSSTLSCASRLCVAHHIIHALAALHHFHRHTAAVAVRRPSPSHVACVGWQRDEQGRPSETTKHSRDALACGAAWMMRYARGVDHVGAWVVGVQSPLKRTHTVRVATIVFFSGQSELDGVRLCLRSSRQGPSAMSIFRRSKGTKVQHCSCAG
jgi:hypothetical protein